MRKPLAFWDARSKRSVLKMRFGLSKAPRVATPPTRYMSLSGPSGPGVSPRVSPKTEGFEGVLEGVSKRCSGHSEDTLRTLFGHSGVRGPFGRWGHSFGHSLDHPRFRGHRRGHFRDTSGPKGPRGSCSRSGGCNPRGIPKSLKKYI